MNNFFKGNRVSGSGFSPKISQNALMALCSPSVSFPSEIPMSPPAAVPTASLKSWFFPLNDRTRDSGIKNESQLPAKSKGCFRLSDGRLTVLVKSR